ncbi:MAG: hypothetical protein ACKVS9_12180 [Phycisphaerae bacterium]
MAWEPVTYQWYFEAAPIAGATSATLAISDVTPADAGDYYVVVDSFCGTGTSDIATVIVHPPCYPDIDGDRNVGLSDLAYLLRSFGLCFGSPGFDPAADINRTNCVDLLDLAQLLTAFGSDCP